MLNNEIYIYILVYHLKCDVFSMIKKFFMQPLTLFKMQYIVKKKKKKVIRECKQERQIICGLMTCNKSTKNYLSFEE